VQIRFPDPEHAGPFTAYRNYVEDMAGSIGGRYGLAETLIDGVYSAVERLPRVGQIQRRRLALEEEQALHDTLRRAWARQRSMQREVLNDDFFDEEANALLPMQGYYVVYHAARAYAVASGQQVPRDHAAALKLLSKEAMRGVFPYPWSVCCTGCPQLQTETFTGIGTVDQVHVWSLPDPDTSDDRLAMFLRTTRQKELDRRFAEARARAKPARGRTRVNLSRTEKLRLATAMPPTTVFDTLWRLRKKANYEDADAFVLGAMTEGDARRFAEALIILTNASLAALEGVMAAYVGPTALAEAAESYLRKSSGSSAAVQVAHRAAAWRRRADGVAPPPPRLPARPRRWSPDLG
jgi:hypothetical protein